MDIKYLTVEHLSTKDLIRLFSKITIDPLLTFAGIPCWQWNGWLSRKGYGSFWHKTKMFPIHRFMYAWTLGPIPIGQQYGEIDHLCRRPHCINPTHLEFVPSRVNCLRGDSPAAINARKEHCINGHLLELPNIWISKKGHRRCKQCEHMKKKIYADRYRSRHPDRVKASTNLRNLKRGIQRRLKRLQRLSGECP
jgi:hypothetical protein